MTSKIFKEKLVAVHKIKETLTLKKKQKLVAVHKIKETLTLKKKKNY